jgi:hypothetical protein
MSFFYYYCSHIKEIKIIKIKKTEIKLCFCNGVEDKVIVYLCMLFGYGGQTR